MKFKKLLSLAMAAIILSGYAAAPEVMPFSDGIILEANAATSSKLKAPAGITKTAGKNTIVLEWKKVSGADGYRVYKYDPAKKKYIKYKSVSGTKCTVTNLESGKKYSFKIVALVKKNGEYKAQTYSEAFSVTTKKLDAPKGITATANYASIALKWKAVSGADAYRVYQYDSAKKKYVSVKTTTSTSCTVSNLKSGKTYRFKVAALVKNGSKYIVQTASSEISKTTSTNAKLQTTDFTVYDGNGKEVKLSDFAGKPIVVNIWATWCGPCTRELPHFNKAYKEYGDDVVFMMVNCTHGRETESGVKSFIKNKGYTFPVYYDKRYSANNAYDVTGIPTTLFIDRDGKLVRKEVGSMSEKELLGYLEEIM